MPFKYTRQQKLNLLQKFVEYVNTNDNPKIAEFCYLNNVDDETLKKWAQTEKLTVTDEKSYIYDFARVLKKSKFKQQTYLEELAIAKGQNPGGPIFLLKALHGLSDGSEQKPQETHVHVHQSADKVKKLEDEDLTSLLQKELLKPNDRKKRKSPSN